MASHMNSYVDGISPEGRSPILNDDICCPRCGYNLRGCAGPQCPECGFAFEPDQLLAHYRKYREHTPPATWVIRTMWRHPVTFWSQPQVCFGRAPSAGELWP